MQACSATKMSHTLSEGDWETKWLEWISRGKEEIGKGWLIQYIYPAIVPCVKNEKKIS